MTTGRYWRNSVSHAKKFEDFVGRLSSYQAKISDWDYSVEDFFKLSYHTLF